MPAKDQLAKAESDLAKTQADIARAAGIIDTKKNTVAADYKASVVNPIDATKYTKKDGCAPVRSVASGTPRNRQYRRPAEETAMPAYLHPGVYIEERSSAAHAQSRGRVPTSHRAAFLGEKPSAAPTKPRPGHELQGLPALVRRAKYFRPGQYLPYAPCDGCLRERRQARLYLLCQISRRRGRCANLQRRRSANYASLHRGRFGPGGCGQPRDREADQRKHNGVSRTPRGCLHAGFGIRARRRLLGQRARPALPSFDPFDLGGRPQNASERSHRGFPTTWCSTKARPTTSAKRFHFGRSRQGRHQPRAPDSSALGILVRNADVCRHGRRFRPTDGLGKGLDRTAARTSPRRSGHRRTYVRRQARSQDRGSSALTLDPIRGDGALVYAPRVTSGDRHPAQAIITHCEVPSLPLRRGRLAPKGPGSISPRPCLSPRNIADYGATRPSIIPWIWTADPATGARTS